ncbi:MAG: glycosyltransferase family 2 protein, partial [Terriglobia bacterium]
MSVEAVLLFLAQVIVFGFYLLLHSFYLFLLGASLYTSRIQPRRARLLVPRELLNSVSTPPVTLLVAAFNERATIVESVRALLGLHYPRLEVIVVNDGSTDGTLEELVRSCSLRREDLFCRPQLPSEPVRGLYVSLVDSRLVVVDKERGGKSDALNAGLNLCRTPWVCTVDADSVLEEEALLRALRPAIEDEQ